MPGTPTSFHETSGTLAPFDLILVGGGLQNGLIALSALHQAPDCRIALVETSDRLGGNHTWCVHARDVPDAARSWFDPLVVQRWASYEVNFPGFARTVRSGYAVVSSERFDQVVRARLAHAPHARLFLQRTSRELTARSVHLEDGEILYGRRVVDARGPDRQAYSGQCGYQKFVGVELQLQAEHGLSRPVLMDATCPQLDGFRFFYVLPLTADRLLVEETRFSLTPELDVAAGRSAALAYATRFGVITRCIREEQGVLPMPWSMPAMNDDAEAVLKAGYSGGFFHPATGYSMPAALRVADLLGRHVMAASIDTPWRELVRNHRIQAIYALQLNRLLFTGFVETDMWGVLARFYHLPESLIERFYAMSSSVADCARILVGWPPRGFSIRRALTPLLRRFDQRHQSGGPA